MGKIIFIGEAWGMKEALFEHPFVGSSGAEFARMLGETQLGPVPPDHPSEYEMMKYWKEANADFGIEVANVFNLHPPDNKIETCFASSKDNGVTSIPPLKAGKYIREDLLPHLEQLWAKIETVKPNLIVAMGNTACWAVLGESKISQLRGTVKMSKRFDIKVLPTYHPAAVLRQWNLRTIVLTDFEKARREAETTVIKRIKRWVTIDPTIKDILGWMNRPARYYAVDIETSLDERPLKHIAMIGFARNDNDALVIPFADTRKPGWSYWQTVEEEMQVRRLIQRLLAKPIPKVFQNGIFDLSYMLREGYRPTMCQDDSMLLHHALYPEMLKGLGFLGSVYSDEIAWKTMRTKGDNLKRDE